MKKNKKSQNNHWFVLSLKPNSIHSSSQSTQNDDSCRNKPTLVSAPYYRLDLFNRQMHDVLFTTVLVTTKGNDTLGHFGTSDGRILQVWRGPWIDLECMRRKHNLLWGEEVCRKETSQWKTTRKKETHMKWKISLISLKKVVTRQLEVNKKQLIIAVGHISMFI